jgi:plasmid stabilization system protein ParE
MAYRVVISDPANADLNAAVGYIAVTLEAPGADAALLDEYEEKLRLVADNPKLFGVDFDVSEAVSKQVRRCAVKRYGIYYTIDDEERAVHVVAFSHSLRDTPAIVRTR